MGYGSVESQGYVSIYGDVMQGPIDMGGNGIIGLADPVDNNDAVTLGFLQNFSFDANGKWEIAAQKEAHIKDNGIHQDTLTLTHPYSYYNKLVCSLYCDVDNVDPDFGIIFSFKNGSSSYKSVKLTNAIKYFYPMMFFVFPFGQNLNDKFTSNYNLIINDDNASIAVDHSVYFLSFDNPSQLTYTVQGQANGLTSNYSYQLTLFGQTI